METQWNIPADLLSRSVEIMRPRGALGNEGLALWLGRALENQVIVSHVVAVDGPGFRSAPLQLSLSLRTFEALTDLAESTGTHLVGQIHSHPGLMLDLSPVDVAYGIRRQGYLSFVCPHYAQKNIANASECGVHMFDGGSYRRMSDLEIARRIRVTDVQVTRIECEAPE